MELLDHETCYQAISRRDNRFDGRFYTGVTTTGIFCRPSCPARTPKSSNVRFYSHAAAASEAGFRPCRRCRPELSPGHPEWNRRNDLTGKAMKLIEAGVVDRIGVSGLAADLGVSERHLRRELLATVGTGPLQLARARRLWLARLLLDQTALTVTDIAYASGFGSLRQFNDSMRTAFGAPPSALRRRVGPLPALSTVSLKLPCRGPLRWTTLHRFLNARAIPGLECTHGDRFRRIVPGGWIEIGPAPTAPETLLLDCSLERLSDLAELLPIVRTVADLDTDLETIEDHFQSDSVLADRLQYTELARLPGPFDRFEVTIRAIVGQQISVTGARTLLGRLLTIAAPDGTDHFPTPTELATADLEGLGMPKRRKATITAMARAVADGTVELGPHVDREVLAAQLLSVPGIGPWTAGYISMRTRSDPDGWPTGDLALRRSTGWSDEELDLRADSWRPWRAYAALLLWNSDPTVNKKPAPNSAAGTTNPAGTKKA